MTILSAFSPSITGMRAQAQAFRNIGANVANVQTEGYKRIETGFAAIVGKNSLGALGHGTVQTTPVNQISRGGLVQASASPLDVSIGGDGFFILNTQRDGSGDTVYTRDGSFRIAEGPETTVTINSSPRTVDTGYLVDKNGYYVQGWAAGTDGGFPNSGTTTSLRVDEYLYINQGQETTSASLLLNLDANEPATGTFSYPVTAYDSNAAERTAHLTFTKTQTPRQWTILPSTDNAGDTVNSTAGTLTFDSDGALAAGGSYTVDITWANGATSNVVLDLADMTQLAADYMPQAYEKNGYGASDMQSLAFDESGYITGRFGDNTARKIYRVPLAQFSVPDALDSETGLIFHESAGSGSARIFAVDEVGRSSLQPNSRELSNVNIEAEFTRIIMTQTAYKASATVFRTLDQTITTARDLKT